MRLSSLHRSILDLAVEDSYALCEIVARIHQGPPAIPPREARERARTAIGELLKAHLVELTRLESPHGKELTLEQQAAARALADDLSWLEPKHARPHVRVAATSAGKDAYYER